VEYVNSISDKLVFLNDKFSNFVITGSLALNIYGLINRITTDTDLIVKELPKCSTINNTNDYNIDELYIPNTRRLGYIYLNNKTSFLEIINILKKRRNYTIDMFYDFDNKVKYNTFKHLGKEYKIQDAIQLIDQKRALLKNYANNKSSTVGAHKHNYDLYKIYKNI
jgi:hypothetical protein